MGLWLSFHLLLINTSFPVTTDNLIGSDKVQLTHPVNMERNEGTVGFYDSSLFTIPEMFPLIFDSISLINRFNKYSLKLLWLKLSFTRTDLKIWAIKLHDLLHLTQACNMASIE